jgi:hypothetical protein
MKHKKRHKKGRRRVGATSLGKTSTLLKVGSVVAGYFLADKINAQIDKFLPSTTDTSVTPNVTKPNEMIGIVGEVGLGGLLLMMKGGKGKTGKIKTYASLAGGVLAGAGIKRVLKKAGVVTGYQSVPVIGRKRMAGYQNVPVVGAIPAQLRGTPGQLQGYVTQGSGMSGYVPAGSGAHVMGSIGCCSASGSGITNSSGSNLMN